MQLKSSSFTFNLGDTSFRRKTLIDDYKEILPFLRENNLEFDTWDNEAQAAFYKKILLGSDLFERNKKEDFAKRGRTLTNSLVKLGLTDSKRRLSKVSINWLTGTSQKADKIEIFLGLDQNNLIFLRQLLKLRVYENNDNHFVYPFRIGITLAMLYRNIPQSNFLNLLHLIRPNFSQKKIIDIINDYKRVDNGSLSFSEFLNIHFPENTNGLSATELFSHQPLNKDIFSKLFFNGKTSKYQDDYYNFVVTLLHFKQTKDLRSLQELLKLSNTNSIRQAFNSGTSIFKSKSSVNEFLEANQNNIFLDSNDSLIYSQFISSKKNNLIKEYRDMTKRTFNLTGIFDFSNGLVNLISSDICNIIFSNISLAGNESLDYEKNLNSPFYQEHTITKILNLKEDYVLTKLQKLLNTSDISNVVDIVNRRKEKLFREFMYKNFPKEKILQILPLFSERNDSKIKKMVSESATVPTIFEYIVGIAWFYLSSEKFYITKSLNLTLDGNMLPLTHAAGGEGDIIIDYSKSTLMLEVTLMNKHAQKRGEWEPVLRHATNLTVDKKPIEVITLFIADELDDNTVNIWRAISTVPLKSSNKDEYAQNVKVFPLNIKNLIYMLQNGQDEQLLLKNIKSSYDEYFRNFDLSWRDEIMFDSKIK